MAPSAGDFEYLIASDANPSDLNDPYYGLFNAEKKFSDGNLRPEIGAPHTTTAPALDHVILATEKLVPLR